MSEPEIELSTAGPVHDEREQDDGQDDDHQPEEEHDDAGDCVPAHASCSSHGRQLPAAAQLIPRQGAVALLALDSGSDPGLRGTGRASSPRRRSTPRP